MALDWDKLRVFHAVALAGSFTRATDILNISQSAISRQVSILEDELGTSLFQRVARGLVLTGAGEKLNSAVTSVFSKVSMTETAIVEERNVPRGNLRVSTSFSFGCMWLAPRLQKFLDQFPAIHIDLLLTKEDTDLNMRKVDVGIANIPIALPEIIHSKPFTYKLRAYASKKYLNKHGIPKRPEDLDHHRLIVYEKSASIPTANFDWLLKLGSDHSRSPFLTVNSAVSMLEAIKGNIGIGTSCRYIAGDDPDLVEIKLNSPDVHRCILYPKELSHLKRIQVFVDFLIGELDNSDL